MRERFDLLVTLPDFLFPVLKNHISRKHLLVSLEELAPKLTLSIVS
jgi:hypothetical protein